MSHSDAFIPYEPLNTLKPVAPEVWIVDGPEIRFDILGLHLPFPTRMTIIRLNDGGLFVHSPIEPSPELMTRIDALGPVRCLIAPSTIHYWWVPDWKDRYPGASVHGVPGLARRARRAVSVDADLGNTPAPQWAEEIDQVLFRGSVVNEAEFFHRATRTLILTDIIENFEPRRVKNFALRWLLRVAGVANPDGRTPKDMQLSFLFQRRAVRAGVERMIGWNPKAVILAHGRWYDGNGVFELRRAFRWILRGAPSRGPAQK